MTCRRLQDGARVQLAEAINCCGTACLSACAINCFNSGMQEPQFVPAFSFAPISAAECAPAAMALQMVVRPTPKQAQTIGPALASPSDDLPDNSMRRWSLLSASAANRLFTTFQSPASRAGPMNRQVSMQPPAKDAAR